MTLKSYTEIRDVHGIPKEGKQRIIDFLQGAIYDWCKNKPKQWFSMRDLMGGVNYDWKGTPLFLLFKKHRGKGKGKDSAIDGAGIDSGWLLKHVIHSDRRLFETKIEERIRKYHWIRNTIKRTAKTKSKEKPT